MSFISRLASRCRSGDPNAFRASAGSRPSAIASSMWDWSSSSISRMTRPSRRTLVQRDHHDMSHGPEHAIDGGGDRLPARLLAGQLFLARRGQFVHARPPSGVLRNPCCPNPPAFLHAVQRRVERAFLHPEHVAGRFLDRGHERVAVQSWAPREKLQDQEIERALEGVGLWHTQTYIYI